MQMFAEIGDVMALQHEALRDGADGQIDNQTLKSDLELQVTEALGACQRLLNLMKNTGG